MIYNGFARFIIFKREGDFNNYELVYMDVTQFDINVPYRAKNVISGEEHGDLIYPAPWLDEYISQSMPYSLDTFMHDNGFKLKEGEFGELRGFVRIEDTSGMTDCGYEYDSELHFENADFTPFKIEDMKDNYYYSTMEIAEWLSIRDGGNAGISYTKLIERGFDV